MKNVTPQVPVVYVVGGDILVVKMFKDRGWDVIIDANFEGEHDWSRGTIDLICFTGGEDVSPELYHEENKGSRGMNPDRDAFEKAVYDEFVGHVPMVGICRGGQLLNVLNGGQMIQDHGLISGDVGSYWNGEFETVLVDHHQGMISGYPDEILGMKAGSDFRQYGIWYSETKCLCFQPHPEWGHTPTEELFFKILKEYIE